MRVLGVCATAAVVVTSIVVVAVTLTARKVAKASTLPTPSYSVGEPIQALPGFDYSEHSLTVLMPVSLSCTDCEETLALYRAVVERLSRSHSAARVVWLTTKDTHETSEYLRQKDLPRGRVVKANPLALRIRALPSVVLVDRDGVIRARWSGRAALNSRESIFGELARFQ